MEITPEENAERTDFIREIVREDLRTGKYAGRVQTRFPPEPNGYLHIGHAKSIHLNFGIADEFGGKTNLRFDDTNPTKEEVEYVDSIKDDIRWLGFDWEEREFYASDYFEQLYEYALKLIKKGKAYVDDLSAEQIREYRGTLTAARQGKPLPEPLGGGEPGSVRAHAQRRVPGRVAVLRAKIDMASGNLNMRDPVLYRILFESHHRTAISLVHLPDVRFCPRAVRLDRRITHSICTLEFEDHRPLYDWFLDELEIYHPQQIEFARLNLTYTVLSKRKLLRLVQEGHVRGWDDPRMPTLSGLRRRGYTPEAIRDFCERIGVAKNDSVVDINLLEYCVRQDLNQRAPRKMAVLQPAQGGDRQLPGRPGGGDGGGEQPRRRLDGNAQAAVLQGAVHRAG